MLRSFQNFLLHSGIQSSFIDYEETLLQFSLYDINFVFMYNAKEDPTYIRLVIPNVGMADEADAKTIRLLYDLTNSYKIGKAYVLEKQIWFSADAFVYNQDNNDVLFGRLITVLRDMLKQYRKTIKE